MDLGGGLWGNLDGRTGESFCEFWEVLEVVLEQVLYHPRHVQKLDNQVDQEVEHLILVLELVVVVTHVKVFLVVTKDLAQTLLVEVVEQVLLELLVEHGQILEVVQVEMV